MKITIEGEEGRDIVHASIYHKDQGIEIHYPRKNATLVAYLASVISKAIMAEEYIENPAIDIVI